MLDMYVKKRILYKPLSVMLILSIMLIVVCLGYSNLLTVDVSAIEYTPNTAIEYYIKNVKSGKYLTVQGANFSAGTNIVQWHFTGDPNQKWKFEETTGSYKGYYRIEPANHTTLAIRFADGVTGTQAKLANKNGTDVKQFFALTHLDNSSYRFKSNSSNFLKALVVNNAGIYDNTSIVQGEMGVQWSDQWLIDPVMSYNAGWGVNYANANYNHRLATYPDFDFCTSSNHVVFESTNFASQCFAAGGMHYYKPSDQIVNNWWYINKVSHQQNVYYSEPQLTNYFYATQSWYNPDSFRNFWLNIKNRQHCTVTAYDLLYTSNYDLVENGIFCFKGDIIQIKDTSGSENQILLTVYTMNRSFKNYTNENIPSLINVPVTTHYNNTSLCNTTLYSLMLNFSNFDDMEIEVIHNC